jgi:hypothetical protein
MVFDTFAVMSSNVKDFVDMAVDYVRGGTPWNFHIRVDSGRASSGVKEALPGSVVIGGMEGIRELGLRQDQVRWYMEDGL